MSPFVQLGVKAAQEQDTTTALGWFRRAHAENPQDPIANAWLGQTLCATGQVFEGVQRLAAAGEGLLRNAQRMKGLVQDWGPAHQVIQQLHAAGAFEQALPLAREAARLAPGQARAQQLLALTCGQLNLTDEALAAAQAAERLAPGDAMLQVLHASLQADARRYDDACDRLEALLQQGIGPQQVGVREAFRAFKELARCLDALGAHEAVFPQLDAAAALARSLPEYEQHDKALVPERVRQAMAGATREGLARFAGQSFAGQERAPVFVMGFFRSGTTLTQQVLAAHPGVYLADETPLVRAMERELDRLFPGSEPMPAKLARLDLNGVTRLRAAYWEAAYGRFGPAAREGLFVDKFTLNTVDLALIATVFPDARLLFVMRDPRDVVLSCVMQLMVPSAATRHLLTLADTAALYAQVMQWWLQVRELLPMRWLEFRYEDAVADFEGCFRRVFDFVGLDWRPEVLAFHQRGAGRYVASPSRNQVAQPLFSSSVQRWRHHAAALAPVQPVLAPFVEAFGYEPA